MGANRKIEFTDQEFERVRQMVHKHTGISLSDAKREMIYGRISRRLRTLGLASFTEYCALLEADEASELEQFTNAVTTNLTAFFRENHHFEYLAATVLPELVTTKAQSRHLRIWSAGCSTGEEVYSIAIVLKECIPNIAQWDVKILATDLDSDVLATAQRGVYAEERVADIARERLQRWFRKGRGQNRGQVKVVSELQDLIHFRQLNLMHEWPMQRPFDIIFCRNVVIYFDLETQKRLFAKVAKTLKGDGCLFIGHSESLSQVTNRFRSLGKTIYRKVA